MRTQELREKVKKYAIELWKKTCLSLLDGVLQTFITFTGYVSKKRLVTAALLGYRNSAIWYLYDFRLVSDFFQCLYKNAYL